MPKAEFSFRVRYAGSEWCVYVKDPRGVPHARYSGFDTQTEAEEWAANFVRLLNAHHEAARGRV